MPFQACSFQDTASALGQRISWPKIKLQNLGAGHQPPSASVDGIDSMDSFVYLGSLLSSDGHCRPHINRRIGLASSVMCALYNITGRTDIICLLVQKSVSTRLLSSQFYSMQQKPGLLLPLTSKLLKPSTWIVRDICRKSVGNCFYDEVAATTDLPSISNVILHRRSALFGHVARLQQDVPAHKALHCHVDLSLGRPPNDQCKRRPGEPEKDGSTRSGRTMEFPRRTCGGVRWVVVTEEQRYGPRWLRDNERTLMLQLINISPLSSWKACKNFPLTFSMVDFLHRLLV